MANDSWATPQVVYDNLNAEFNFCADMAADDLNNKHRVYWTEQDEPNSLDADWHLLVQDFQQKNPWVWCNPPYSDIGPWIDQAIKAQDNGVGSVFLVMAGTSEKWFSKAAKHATEIRFVANGRIAFLENGKRKSGNNKGSVIFVFAPNLAGLQKVTFVDRADLLKTKKDIAA